MLISIKNLRKIIAESLLLEGRKQREFISRLLEKDSDFDKFYSISLDKKKAISFVKNHKKAKKNMGLYLPYDKINKKDYFNVKLSRQILESYLKKQAKQKVKNNFL